jgi:hypothetical protein
MGFVVPFYVPLAWAVTGAAWVALCLRRPSAVAVHWREASTAGLATLISVPVVIYSVWVFTSDPVYGAWAAQKQFPSPHPLHYVAAYGMPLAIATFAVKEAWRAGGWAWLAVSWVAAVPLLVYLPVNVQLRLAAGVQVPLSLLAAQGAMSLWRRGRRWPALSLLAPMMPTSFFLLVSSTVWMMGRPSPSFRDASELVALDQLAARSRPGDAVLTAYDTGAYLPARVDARVLAGHDLEAMDAGQKKASIDRFFDAATTDSWRQEFLTRYGVDYVFWGPAERDIGEFDPYTGRYLSEACRAGEYTVFAVEQ